MKYHIVTLGCPKNAVDSEGMDGLLAAEGHTPAASADDADLIVVNTCSFIASAREETLGVLRTLGEQKREDQQLIAAGCMAQSHGELVAGVAGVDHILSTQKWMQIGALCWAAGTLMLRHTRTAVSNEALTVGMMTIGAGAMALFALLAEPLPDPSAWSGAAWAAIVYCVLLNYGYAQVLWFGMARRLPPSASAFSIMAVPLVGTLAATVVVGERPQVADFAAAIAVAVAILSALRPKRQSAPR